MSQVSSVNKIQLMQLSFHEMSKMKVTKTLILFSLAMTCKAEEKPSRFETHVNWFFSQVNKNAAILLDRRLNDKVIALDRHPFQLGLILPVDCFPDTRNITGR